MARRKLVQGTPAAAASAFLLGLTPILGKLAITSGLSPYWVVALRTAGASLLLFLVLLLFQRQSFYIYPLGLIGCLLAGLFNGIGSIFFYQGLSRVDAGLAQLLYSLYPIFVALLLFLDGYHYTRMTVLRVALSIPALLLLTSPANGTVDAAGAAMMVGAGFLYALHIPINQRVLYDAPAPTVTFYTLIAMTIVVIPPALLIPDQGPNLASPAVVPVIALTLVTFLSRLSLFTGVKYIGGLDTALIGLGEIVISLGLALIWLGEELTPSQWVGALLLAGTIMLLPFDERQRKEPPLGGWLRWLLPRARYMPTEQQKAEKHTGSGSRGEGSSPP